MMRFHGLWVTLLLSAAAFAAGAARVDAAEKILDYRSDIVVGKDGKLTITETIKVRAEGRKIKRGIYRDLPTDYRDPGRGRVRVGYDVLAVTRDGKTEPWHVSDKRSGYKRIYIGDKNRNVKKGEHTYTIKYKPTRPMVGFFD